MAQQFNSMRSGSAIKTDLARLSDSLSTGKVSDLTEHLGGRSSQFSGLSHSLSQIAAYVDSAQETELQLTNMQLVLGHVQTLAQETSGQLLLVSNSSTADQISETARSAHATFVTMVDTINTQFADRALFGGTTVDVDPLASAEDMLADIQAAIGGATSFAAISTIVSDWFADPAGGFATMGYQAGRGAHATKNISDTTRITIDARADDPAIKETLKATVLAALAHELPGIDTTTKADLLKNAGIELVGATDRLVSLQSRVGHLEETVAGELTSLNAQATALSIAKNELEYADPYETASRLQAVQLQLETHYAVTARMSQLSLLSYMS
ncbi:hypothetical protein TW80_00465 [Loktanella sp. S4079]|nr:hypothetical protein TW80_00465 [Loktanella sp. S4079]